MEKRELLEAAARAAGYNVTGSYGDGGAYGFWLTLEPRPFAENTGWNPLDDDGDALRLAVKLGFTVEIDVDDPDDACTRILNSFGGVLMRHMHHDGGAESATRHAITRAAAAIDAQRRESK